MKNAIHCKQKAVVPAYEDLKDLPSSTQEQLAHLKSGIPTVVVLYYGGTIGMKPDARGHLVPTDDARDLLQPLTGKGLSERMNVIWFPVWRILEKSPECPGGIWKPKAIDSTNGRWVHWVTIANALRLIYDLVDGFVVCGGTDTMAYVTAALHYIFPNIGKPAVACASQISMHQLGDDGQKNLYFALSAAAGDLSGCHLAFGDFLRHGLHVFKVKDKALAAFDSPPRFVIGEYDGDVHIFPNAPRRNPLVTKERLEYNPNFHEGVKVVRISPATPCESLLHDAKDPFCSALLLVTYGAGNVRDEGLYEGEKTHIDIMTELHARGYPVVLGSSMMDGKIDSPYISGAKAVSEEVGGISSGDTCGPSLEVKMMRCLSNAWGGNDSLDYQKFRSEIFRNHVGELTMKVQK